MTKRHTLAVVVGVVSLAGCGQSTNDSGRVADSPATSAASCPAADAAGNIDIAPGLSARIIKKGWGRAAVEKDYADTNVWLWQYDESADDRRGPFIWESGSNIFQFQIGAGQVIKGWDLGVPCMLVGETRELVVASDLAYGAQGHGDSVPPNTPLIFKIELVKLTTPE